MLDNAPTGNGITNAESCVSVLYSYMAVNSYNPPPEYNDRACDFCWPTANGNNNLTQRVSNTRGAEQQLVKYSKFIASATFFPSTVQYDYA